MAEPTATEDQERPHVWLRGEGGSVLKHDLPLNPAISDRLRAGHLTRVNEDGTAYTGDEPLDAVLSEDPRTGVRADKVVVAGVGDVAGVRVVSGELVELEPVTAAPPETRQVPGAVVADRSTGDDVVGNPDAATTDQGDAGQGDDEDQAATEARGGTSRRRTRSGR